MEITMIGNGWPFSATIASSAQFTVDDNDNEKGSFEVYNAKKNVRWPIRAIPKSLL